MHRTPRSLVSLLALLALGGCGVAQKSPAKSPRLAESTRTVSACDAAPGLALGARRSLEAREPPLGARIARVELVGATSLPRSLLASQVESRAGDVLDEQRVAGDVRRLLALEALADVAVETEEARDGAVVLRFRLSERKLIGAVAHRGLDRLPSGRWLPLAAGEIYDPLRVTRAAHGLALTLVDRGYLDAAVEPRARVADDHRVDVCLRVHPGPRYAVAAIRFPGAHAIPPSELSALLHTDDGKANTPGAPYRADMLAGDVPWILARYYDAGYVEVAVDSPRVLRDPANGRVDIEIPIQEGSRFRVGKIRFRGGVARLHAEDRLLLGIREGSVFDRSALMQGMNRVERRHRDKGRPVSVTPETHVDAERRLVDVTLVLGAPE